MNPNDKLIGKIIIKAKLQLLSPAIIGNGNEELADVEVLRDSKSGLPFIPATSLMGVLKHYIGKKNFLNEMDGAAVKKQLEFLLGKQTDKADPKNGSSQSALICSDLSTEEANVVIRDGVAINAQNGVAEEQKKYDYEVIEPGATFDLFWEINLRQKFNKEIFKKLLKTILNALENEKIKIGASTNKGFGRIKLTDLQYDELDFINPAHVLAWIKGTYCTSGNGLNVVPYQIEDDKTFQITAWFAIKNSLIVRSYPHDLTSPDAVHLKSGSDYVLPGTSTRGAIRHRALKILNTLEVPEITEKMDRIFGYIKEGTNKKAKGNLLVEETVIDPQKAVTIAELQNRTKIDRFTGGVIEGALFDSMPLWQKNKTSPVVNISFTLKNFEDWEAGLLLHILKDLWLGDLPIGGEKNVGRGVLQGLDANIIIKSAEQKQNIRLHGNMEIAPEGREILEGYAKKLWEMAPKESEAVSCPR